MSASTDPPADAELLRLLDDYGDTERWAGEAGIGPYRNAARQLRKERDRARAALLDFLNRTYVRWDHLQEEWDEMERSRTHFALPEEVAGPPIATGPLARRAVRIRLVREDAAPSWEDWRATVGNGRVRHNRTSWVGQIVMDTKEGVDVAWDGRDDVVFYEPYEAMDKLEPEDARCLTRPNAPSRSSPPTVIP